MVVGRLSYKRYIARLPAQLNQPLSNTLVNHHLFLVQTVGLSRQDSLLGWQWMAAEPSALPVSKLTRTIHRIPCNPGAGNVDSLPVVPSIPQTLTDILEHTSVISIFNMIAAHRTDPAGKDPAVVYANAIVDGHGSQSVTPPGRQITVTAA